MLAEHAVLPHLHDPGGQQVLHRRDGQHRVALRIGAAVGDVHALVAEQQLKQQAPDPAERPLHGLLGPCRRLLVIRRVHQLGCG